MTVERGSQGATSSPVASPSLTLPLVFLLLLSLLSLPLCPPSPLLLLLLLLLLLAEAGASRVVSSGFFSFSFLSSSRSYLCRKR
jgi:hypothetical protein